MQRFFLNLAIVALLMPYIDIYAESSFLQEYVNKYPYYLAVNHPSTVALVTDRTYYKPGEKVAFLAVVHPPSVQAPVSTGNLFVQLRDMTGQLLSYTRYPVFSGQASGEIALLADLPDGIYQLVAFTDPGSRAAFDADQVLPIVVSKEDPGPKAEVVLNKKFYAPSDILAARVVFKAEARPKRVAFELRSASQVFARGDFNPQKSSTEGIGMALPSSIDKPLFLRITWHSDEGKVSQNCYIPVVNREPDCEIVLTGGSLIAHQENQLGINVRDAFGIPLSVPFTVSDLDGELLTKGHTNVNGKSLVTLQVKDSGRYKWSFGEEQVYHLMKEVPVREGFGVLFGGIQSGRLIFFAKPNSVQQQETNWVLFSNGEIVYASQMKMKDNQMITLPVPPGHYGIMEVLVMDKVGKTLLSRSVYLPSPANEKATFVLENGEGYNNTLVVPLMPEISRVPSLIGISLGPANVYSTAAVMGALYCVNPDDAQVDVFFRPLRVPDADMVLSADTTTKQLIAGYRFNVRMKGQPVGKAKVWVKDVGNLSETSLIADENGEVTNHFGESVVQMPLLYFSAFDSTGRKKAQIVFDTPFEAAIDSALIVNQSEALHRAGLIAARYSLQIDFVFNALRPELPDEPSKYNQKVFSSYSSVLEIIRTLKPFEIMDNQIVFPGGRNSFYAQQGALIIIDGVKMGTSIETLKMISPSEIKDVFISTDPVDIQKHTALNSQGIIEIYTFLPEKERAIGTQPVATKPDTRKVATFFPAWPENAGGYQIILPDDLQQVPGFGRVFQLNADGTFYYSDIYTGAGNGSSSGM